RRNQARRGRPLAERLEGQPHQPVRERGLVEERLAAIARDEPVAGLDHGARAVEEVDLGALQRGFPEGGKQHQRRRAQEQRETSGEREPELQRSAAGSAAGSFLRWSWPHAARMSWPRGRRTDTVTPASARMPQKA